MQYSKCLHRPGAGSTLSRSLLWAAVFPNTIDSLPMSTQTTSSAGAPSATWYVIDSTGRTVGPVTDFELREGLLIFKWGVDASVSVSATGPWTTAGDVRQQYLHLIEHGWYVRSEADGQCGGPFTAEKIRRLAESQSLANVQVRSGRDGQWQSAEVESWAIPPATVVAPESAGQPIQAKCRCPHCWHEFSPDAVRWIASHVSLRGDSVVGPEAMRRFLASDFNVDGDALDAAGDICSRLACPKCHLEIPRAIIELQPTAIAVVGAPGSGKSYFLASAVETLQRRLSEHDMMFRDAQVDLNGVLSDYRRTLFWSDQPDTPVALPKTEPQGSLYQSVHLGGRDVWYPKPFMYRWLPSLDHPLFPLRSSVGRVLCLYDIAGEQFLPGSHRAENPASDHLSRSNSLLFLFDPTQHAPIRSRLQEVSSDPQLELRGRSYTQSEVLDEVLERIRRRRGVAGVDRIDAPLIIAITKFDVWEQALGGDPLPDDIDLVDGTGPPAIDIEAINEISSRVRLWLRSSCPEIVHAAENQVENVYYIPTSSQGTSPELHQDSDILMVKPSSISPRFADVPLLLAMHFSTPRLIPARVKTAQSGDETE
jgi:hypothetical protein